VWLSTALFLKSQLYVVVARWPKWLVGCAKTVLLRADLHIAFDKPRIAFVPKSTGDGGNKRLVAHLLEYSPELEHLYHNRELHPTAVGVRCGLGKSD
jgi:hypothetical protein